jgi:hypothetical protein
VGRVTAKRLELLNEVIPSLHRAGVLLIRDSEINGPSMELMEERGKACAASQWTVASGGAPQVVQPPRSKFGL